MKIVFATLHVRRSRQAVPLAAACLGASLTPERRKRTALVDLFPDQPEALMLEAILAHEPELVAFSIYAWNRKTALQLARQIRNRSPQTVLVAGGPEATADPQPFLRGGAFDGVVRGDGEAIFSRLVEALEKGADPAGIAGLSWGTTCGAADDEELPALEVDQLPSPWLTGLLTPGEGVLWET
nr:B12-binding domain-containing radical SAM protein [Desulfuromonadales bacterium]